MTRYRKSRPIMLSSTFDAILFALSMTATALALAAITWLYLQRGSLIDPSGIPFTDTLFIAFVIAVPFSVLMAQNTLALSRKQHELEALATTDPITQLLNRRAFYRMLAAEQFRMQRLETTGAIVFVDVDQFKSINDSYGHDAGDHILQDLAAALRMNLRPSIDHVARWGGEEFVIMLSNVNHHEAWKVCERLRRLVENRTFQTPKGTIRITASFGWARFLSTSDLDAAIAQADAAVYEAKRRGRNQVFSPHQIAPVPESAYIAKNAPEAEAAKARTLPA